MDPEVNRQLHALFDAHDKGMSALRAANKAMGDAIPLQDSAVQEALDANRAALALLARLTNGDS
jgi:hypothetical protein